MKSKIIILTGPTASGKTALSVQLARNMMLEIINSDAMQVYSDIPVITAQPTEEEKCGVNHHLFGYKPGDISTSVADWLDDAKHVVNKIIFAGKKTPILVGGSGMYIKAFIEGISKIPQIDSKVKEESKNLFKLLGNQEFYKLLLSKDANARKLNSGDSQRIIRAYEVITQTGKSIFDWHDHKSDIFFTPDSFCIVNIDIDRNELVKRINERFLIMLENGALDEADFVRNNYFDKSLTIMKAHGLPELINYLDGKVSLPEAIEIAQINTRQYAKRQRTWMRNQLSNYRKIDYDIFSGNIHNLIIKLQEFLHEE